MEPMHKPCNHVLVRLGGCGDLHGSLQFFALGLLSLLSPNSLKLFFNVWTAQFESDSRVPLVAFRDDFGVRESILD